MKLLRTRKHDRNNIEYYEDESGQQWKINVYYALGGMNYFTYKPTSRGYYLSVTPVEISTERNIFTEAFTIFTGYKHILKEANRYSAKVLAEVTKEYLRIDHELVVKLIEATRKDHLQKVLA